MSFAATASVAAAGDADADFGTTRLASCGENRDGHPSGRRVRPGLCNHEGWVWYIRWGERVWRVGMVASLANDKVLTAILPRLLLRKSLPASLSGPSLASVGVL